MDQHPPASVPHVRVAIAGSGFSGLGTGIRLRQQGIDDFVILERAGDIGGTWRDNSYPGCACDVESHLYSFSFAPNPGWSRKFSPQPEILGYLRGCAERFGLLPHVRLRHEVLGATWQGDRWRIETSAGPLTADVLVSATGALSEPVEPDLPGLRTFAGKTFHSARWDHAHDLAGRRVAVIGTGASAIQFVPEIQPRVGKLHLFQRTPPWVLPRRDREIPALRRALYRRFPPAQRLARGLIHGLRELMTYGFRHPEVMRHVERMALRHLAAQVRDPALRRKLTPSYVLGCKRVLLSDDYLPALTRDNVEVVTDAIVEVRPRSILTADGTEREVDTIILGTGFRATDPPLARLVRGRDGRTLAEAWGQSMRAHLGTTVAGFPNFFVLLGPNTGLGHTSVVIMIESQIEHLLQALRFLRERGAGAIEPRPEAQAAFVAEVDARMRGTVWTSGGCQSWYLDRSGRNSTLWPDTTWAFRQRVHRFDETEYAIVQRPLGP